MAVPQTIATGLGRGCGCAYLPGKNQLIFVDSVPGNISAVDLATMNTHVLGTGYNFLLGIALTADRTAVYVTQYDTHHPQGGGDLLRVDLANPDRAHATLVGSGMDNPMSIVVDDARGLAYVVENGGEGRLLRIDLATGTKTELSRGLGAACGLLVTHDYAFAYATERHPTGRICCIDLVTGQRRVVVDGLSVPSFLAWAGSGETALYVTEGGPAHRLTRIDLSQTPPAVTAIAALPDYPQGIALATPSKVLVCSQNEISLLDLDSDDFNVSSPLFMGIGHVPSSHIVGGYANTDPGCPIRAIDSPFGGTLPLRINHVYARGLGANFYRVKVDGVIQRGTFWDYLRNPITEYDDWTRTEPQGDGFYLLRQAGQYWQDPWLGHWTDTSVLSNGLHTITVEVYADASDPALPQIGQLDVMIDNRWPTAAIEKFFHRLAGPLADQWEEVSTCAVVETGTDEFSLQITACDPEGHLGSWSLVALWGDNQSDLVGHGEYVPVPGKQWLGISSEKVPPWTAPWHARRPNDVSSYRCAHTFYLGVWDRVINGDSYLHWSGYHKSITILLPHLIQPIAGVVAPG